MALNNTQKIVWKSWDLIHMPDTVMVRVNKLGGDQPKQLTFIDRNGHLIRFIEIPGVGAKSKDKDLYAEEANLP